VFLSEFLQKKERGPFLLFVEKREEGRTAKLQVRGEGGFPPNLRKRKGEKKKEICEEGHFPYPIEILLLANRGGLFFFFCGGGVFRWGLGGFFQGGGVFFFFFSLGGFFA